MNIKLLTEHHLEFLSLKGGCTGLSEYTLVKMLHCWKSHVMAQILASSKFSRGSLIPVDVQAGIHTIEGSHSYGKTNFMSLYHQVVHKHRFKVYLVGVKGIYCLFCCFTSQINSYGHCGTVSSPNHTFSWASLNKQLTSTSCTYFRL